MNIELSWTDFKTQMVARSIGLHYVSNVDYYYVSAFDGPLCFFCKIPLDGSDPTDQTDFETNYKTNANKNILANTTVETQPPYGSKVITINGVVKKLFARFTGAQYPVVSGPNTLSWTCPYPWVKIIGVEVVNCEALDTADFKVYDTAAGTYSGTPNALLNQFSYTLNMPKDFYQRMAQFDADMYQGMVIQIAYNSVSAKTVGINLLMDQVV